MLCYNIFMAFYQKFFSFFPPPRFLTMPSLGIHISDTAIRAIQLEKRNDEYKTIFWDEIPLPAGAISNGEIVDAQAVSTAIKSISKKCKEKFAYISIPEEKSFLFETEIPIDDNVDIEQAIEFKLVENVPFSANELVFDYIVASELNCNNKSATVSVSAVPKNVVERFINVFNDAGIDVVNCETESRALVKSLIHKNDLRTTLVIDFSESKTIMSIVHNGAIHFSTVVPIGSSLLINAIAKTFNVSKEKAVKLKKSMSSFNEKTKIELFESVFNTFSAVKDEIGRVLAYWKNQQDKKQDRESINRIIICGSDATLPGFEKYLRLTTKNEIDLGNVWINILDIEKNIPSIPFELSLNFAGALGLAISSEQNKND